MLPNRMPTSSSLQPTRIPAPLMVVLVLLAISVFINYIDRGNLSIAAPMVKNEMNISAAQLGFLLSAFFWTYAFMHLFSGWLVDRFNANLVFASGFFLWSVATAVTGFVHTFSMLFALRLLVGVGESVSYPSYNKMLALNFTQEHRGTANSVLSTGLLLGPGFGMLFGGLLMARFGWRPFFIVLGLGSLLWLVPWLIWMPKKAHAPATDMAGAPGLLELLQLRSVWGSCVGLFCLNYVNYFLITWLPYYLVRERNFSMRKMARIGGIAYFLGACFAAACGRLSDRWIASGAHPSLVRKTFTGGGVALTGLFIGLAVVLPADYCPAAVILGVIFMGASSSNIWTITQTLAGPKAAGRWAGFQCFVGNLAGIVAPAVTGFVLQRTGQFFWAFVIMTAIAWTGTAAWIFFVGPVEPVIWRTSPRFQKTLA
jgi:ACS family D-galactonate transporter-like MFS transporter